MRADSERISRADAAALLGRDLTAWVLDGAGAAARPPLWPLAGVLEGAALMSGERIRLDAALGLVVSHWGETDFTPQTHLKFTEVASRFVNRCQRVYSIAGLDQVTRAHVEGFVSAPTARRRVPPAPGTMHLRRSAIRVFFATCRWLGLCDADPTLDIVLPPRDALKTRPLTDDEIQLGRAFVIPSKGRSLGDTREPAAWALAEATATSAEIPLIWIADIDLEAGRYWNPGSNKTCRRWCDLNPWGLRTLSARLAHLRAAGADPHTPIVYQGGTGSLTGPQVSCAKALRKILDRAGITDAAVTPLSISSWWGAHVFEETGDLHLVTDVLGVGTMRTAAERIGLNQKPRRPAVPPPHRANRS